MTGFIRISPQMSKKKRKFGKCYFCVSFLSCLATTNATGAASTAPATAAGKINCLSCSAKEGTTRTTKTKIPIKTGAATAQMIKPKRSTASSPSLLIKALQIGYTRRPVPHLTQVKKHKGRYEVSTCIFSSAHPIPHHNTATNAMLAYASIA